MITPVKTLAATAVSTPVDTPVRSSVNTLVNTPEGTPVDSSVSTPVGTQGSKHPFIICSMDSLVCICMNYYVYYPYHLCHSCYFFHSSILILFIILISPTTTGVKNMVGLDGSSVVSALASG